MPVVDGHWVMPRKASAKSIATMPFPIKGRGGEDVWSTEEIAKALSTPVYQLEFARAIAMDLEQHAVEVSGAAEDALESLKVAVEAFRGRIANDLSAMKSASSKVQAETMAMKRAYQEAAAILTTSDFERAIANAERMAVALQAIHGLSETKLSVAVFSGGKHEQAKA